MPTQDSVLDVTTDGTNTSSPISSTDATTASSTPVGTNGSSSSDTSDTSASSSSAGTTTPNDASSGDTTTDAGATTASGDNSGTATSNNSSNGDTSSDNSADAMASSDDTAGTTASSDTSGAGQTQTPAAQLQLDPIQPASVDAVVSATTASRADTAVANDAVATDAESGVSIKDVIAVGETVAKLMAASSADYTMKSNPISVLPRGVDPLSLTGVYADPHEMRVVIAYRNGMPSGADLMINLPIVVQWRFGGSYKGSGRYITGASMFLDSGADTGAFYKVDVDASFANPFTSDSPAGPVAAIDLLVSIKVVDKISPNSLLVVLNGTIHGDGSGKIAQRP